MERILEIKEVTDVRLEGESYGAYDGYEIVTTEQSIKLLISNDQSCCENWGYVVSEDDLSSFIRAELLSVATVDTGVNAKMVEAGEYLDEGDIMFLNLNTSAGLLQFAVYNGHNGYYGHSGKIISNQLTEEFGL